MPALTQTHSPSTNEGTNAIKRAPTKERSKKTGGRTNAAPGQDQPWQYSWADPEGIQLPPWSQLRPTLCALLVFMYKQTPAGSVSFELYYAVCLAWFALPFCFFLILGGSGMGVLNVIVFR